MTPATNESPTKRVMSVPQPGGREEFAVELSVSNITIRPKGTRKGGPAEVVLNINSVYTRALMDRTRPIASGRKVRRGLA